MIWIFSFSAIFLTLFLSLKAWEVKREQTSFFSKLLSSQDALLQKLHFVPMIFSSFTFRLKRRLSFLVFNRLPFYSHLFITKVSVKIVEYYGRIKDNIMGKYQKFRTGRSNSKYFKEISKVKEMSKDVNKSENTSI